MFLRKLVRLNAIALRRSSRGDIFVTEWDWPEAPEPFGEGTYVYRDGDWVRP